MSKDNSPMFVTEQVDGYTHGTRLRLADADVDRLHRRGDRKFEGYYISFEPTGIEAIDLILIALAAAAKGYHSTEMWNEVDSYYWAPASFADVIQAAANTAADEWRRAVPDDQ